MPGKPLRVAFPLGIGDCHWSCTKLRALSAYHDGRPIHAYVNRSPNHLSVGYLRLVPTIEKAYESPDAPYDVVHELPPNHQDARWSSLEGSRNWAGFDYVAVANGHLERGHRLESWWPELETEFSYPLNIPSDVVERMQPLANRVLVYLSGMGPNHGFHRGTWRVADWVAVLTALVAEGLEPLLVGAKTKDDLGYRDLVRAELRGVEVEDFVGRTSLPEYCELIRTARVWVGLNSGGGIVAAMLGTPTVMLWSDSKYPIPGVRSINLPLNSTMQTSWLSPEQLRTYRTKSFGSPQLTSANLVRDVLEVLR